MAEKVESRNSIVGIVVRFVINAIVLMIVSFFVPGFTVHGFWAAVLAAIVIALLDYVVQSVFKIDASPFGRGISGFIVAAIIIYLTQFVVPGFSVSFFGAAIGALLIGIIGAVVPARVF